VDETFRTSKENIWAFGDAIGKWMFRHTANRAAQIVFRNSMHGAREKLDFSTVPHAVFSYPPIASVGMGEAEARRKHRILVGLAAYTEAAKGVAMRENDSFAKAVVEKDTWRILGFHIIGPCAPILIQEVVNAMASAGTVAPIVSGIHIHPALSEVIINALRNLREPD